MVNLEMLSEDTQHEMTELEEVMGDLRNLDVKKESKDVLKICLKRIESVCNNLDEISDSIYQEFEERYPDRVKELEEENEIFKQILCELLSEQDQQYWNRKFNKELF